MTFIAPLLIALSAIAQPPADPHSGLYTRALGVGCAYCHDVNDWRAASRRPFGVAVRMQAMLIELESGPLEGRGGLSCVMCHRGAPIPRPIPERSWRDIFDEWPATATVPPRRAGRPAREIYRNLEVLGSLRAGDIRVAMSVIAASLGVNCEYCHAGDEWDSDNKPAKKTAREMLRIDLPREAVAADSLPVHCYVCHGGSTEPRRR